MAGVSTLGQLNAQLRRFDTLGTQFADLQNQLASTKKTDRYDGLGAAALSSLRYRTAIQGGEQYVQNIDVATARIKTTTGNIDLIQAQVKRLQTGLLQQPLEGETDLTKIQAYTDKLLEMMPGNLNEQLDGRYVMAGSDYTTLPYNGDDKLKALVTKDMKDWQDGTITTEQLMTKINSYTDDEVGFSAEVITAGKVTVRADTDIEMDYTFKASDVSIKQILVATQVLDQLKVPGETDAPTVDNFQQVLQAMTAKLNEGATGLEARSVAIIATQTGLDEVRTRHKFDEQALSAMVMDVENVDVTETAVKLQSIKLQLEASYSISASLSSLNLVSFLGPG